MYTLVILPRYNSIIVHSDSAPDLLLHTAVFKTNLLDLTSLHIFDDDEELCVLGVEVGRVSFFLLFSLFMSASALRSSVCMPSSCCLSRASIDCAANK